jgi:hypothetical protein
MNKKGIIWFDLRIGELAEDLNSKNKGKMYSNVIFIVIFLEILFDLVLIEFIYCLFSRRLNNLF